MPDEIVDDGRRDGDAGRWQVVQPDDLGQSPECGQLDADAHRADGDEAQEALRGRHRTTRSGIGSAR